MALWEIVSGVGNIEIGSSTKSWVDIHYLHIKIRFLATDQPIFGPQIPYSNVVTSLFIKGYSLPFYKKQRYYVTIRDLGTENRWLGPRKSIFCV